jgi:uncharacterized membrane protein YhaH (DUF805 family)
MKKIALISLLSNITLFAKQTKQIDESMPWMLPWLVASLLSVGLVFWGIYKSMKTQNHKYGYVILLGMLLLVGLLFI